MTEQYVSDGTLNFVGGQDASKIPSRVPEDSYFSGVNISVSKGVPAPRWGNVRKKLKFPDEGLRLPNNAIIPYAEIFSSGRFQAFIPYRLANTFYLIVIVSGIIFFINQDTYEVKIIPIQGGGSLNENNPRLNWSNAGKFLVIFDFPNFPIIFDGITARRADPAKFEVPVSVLGAYNQNRLFISNAGNEFTAGDPTGSLATPNAPITFEEIEAPAAAFLGQIFELPTNYFNEEITAMGFLQFTDTSTGIGPLLVATENAIYSYQSQIPRNQWEANTFGTNFVASAGVAGPRGLINVNADLFFISPDGQIRTASMSRDEQKKWARVPISREVQNWLKYWDKSLVSYAVLGYFMNKIFITVNPYRVPALNTARQPIFDIAHGGLIVLELDNLATLGKDGTPAWAGLWTGLRPLDMAINNNRFFVMSKDEASTNQLYEIDPAITYDVSGEDIRYVKSVLYTREYDFKNPFHNRDLHSIDLGLRNVQGDFNIDVKFKPSHGSQFLTWGKFSHIAPWRNCGLPQGCDINGLAAHNFRDITIGSPIDGLSCDPVSKSSYSNLRKVQLKFIIEGKYWELQEFKVKAIELPQSELSTSCDVFCPAKLCTECDTDWFIGAFKSCQSLVT